MNFSFMRAKKIYEAIDFERGLDPKRSMRVGHAEIFPDKDLFLRIHKYCTDNRFPEFDRVTPIFWDNDAQGNPIVEPQFKAFVKEGPSRFDDNFYTVYLTSEGVIAFHEYQDFEGQWREQEHEVPYADFWRRMMEANHIGIIHLEENLDFKRGQDPHKALKIGKYSKIIPEIVSVDIEIMPEPGNQDTYYDESIDPDEVIALFNNWDAHVKDDNYGFWVLEDGGPYDAENDVPDYWLWKDLEGMTVKYMDELYDIPKTKYKAHK